jgi:Holliday junction resolvase RusA-like endonuclease
MEILNITIPITLVTNNTKHRILYKNGKAFISSYKPKKIVDYEIKVRACIEEYMILNDIDTLSNAVETIIEIGVTIPKSFTKKKRANAIFGSLLPTTRPDLDNYIYLITNCLKPNKKLGMKSILSDDSIICKSTSTKVYSENPYIKIIINDL